MARVVVDVMPKPEILDPQGKAVTGALARLGFAGMSVRQGKRFEIELEGELTEERLDEVAPGCGDVTGEHRHRDFQRTCRGVAGIIR
jgi:phosphoribosylformylglycinamidine (FGAM) synthase PurS component